jgi:hypothetical protein
MASGFSGGVSRFVAIARRALTRFRESFVNLPKTPARSGTWVEFRERFTRILEKFVNRQEHRRSGSE